MRHIILVLIALVALGGLLPAIMAEPAAPVLSENRAAIQKPADSALLTTPSMASFLNDNSVFPSKAKVVIIEKSIDLKGHVLLQLIFRC